MATPDELHVARGEALAELADLVLPLVEDAQRLMLGIRLLRRRYREELAIALADGDPDHDDEEPEE